LKWKVDILDLLLSRIPVFDVYNNTIAYELLYEDHDPRQVKEFILKYRSDLLNKKAAFLQITPNLLKGKFPLEFSPQSLYLVADFQTLSNKEALSELFALQKTGYSIVLESFMLEKEENKPLFDFADVVKIDMNSQREHITEMVNLCHAAEKKILLSGVETQEDFEYAHSIGCSFIQGFYFSKPVLSKRRSGGPMIRTFLQVIALVYGKDPDIETIASIISTDPVLTIRLLRIVNSIISGTGNTISSVQQALVLLGLDRLKEWVYMVGLQRLNREAPDELIRLALFRACFCERIAKQTDGIGMKAKEVYLMGLISIVTGIKGPHLANYLSGLPISNEIKAGLMGEENIFSELYYLANAAERGLFEQMETYAQKHNIRKSAMMSEYIYTIKFVDSFEKP
jgi:c-di-GMP-related signal transduction protein